MSTNVKGTVKRTFETKQVSDKFSKQELAIETDGKYPQVLLLEASGDRIALLNGLSVGDQVSAEIDLRGREWKNNNGEIKYFTTLSIYKLERTSQAQQSSGNTSSRNNDQDDIPFGSCSLALEPSPIARVLR
jgi:hypothetical protein